MALKVSTHNFTIMGYRESFKDLFSTQIGIIGGTGLNDPDIMRDREEIIVDTCTPYGKV